jgi:thioredoxin 1
MHIPKKEQIIEVGETDFEAEVLNAEKPVLVVFLAPWSRRCRACRPVLDEIAAAFAGSVRVLRVNADDNPSLSFQYEVQFIPTAFFFVKGVECLRITGLVKADAMLSKLESCLQNQALNPNSTCPPRPQTNIINEGQ